MHFVDELRLSLRSGRGGAGCISFFRGKYTPRGGPDGGDGGAGGDVCVLAHPALHSLWDIGTSRHYFAGDGESGGSQNRSGRRGASCLLRVPVGTILRDENQNILMDCDHPHLHAQVLLRGGRGGRGNTFFKSSCNQTPRRAQPGELGQEVVVHLELKLLADVGLIGFPNAGKSTLLSRLSAARPKVASYPFTTLQPHLGVVRTKGGSFVAADIPGLIPGAHKGVGLGIRFLKHIERTRVFVHVIDAFDAEGGGPLRRYEKLNQELHLYDREHRPHPLLQERKQIVILNKSELLSQKEQDQFISSFQRKGVQAFILSAVTGLGIEHLVEMLGAYTVQ